MYLFSWTRVAGSLLIAAAVAATAGGQTLSLPGGTLYKAGPDYASDVLQDAWDFSNPDDIAPDPDQMLNWSSPDPATVRSAGTGQSFLSGGWFRGIPAVDSNIALLYRADALALNPGRSGARFPIDPTRYRKLAVKMRVTGAPVTSLAVAYWFHASILEPNWTNRGGSALLAPTIPAGNSEQVYILDLSQASPVYAPGAPYTAESLIKGFRLDPIDGAAGGVEIDWVRLTASNNQADAALMPVSLSGCSALQSLTVTDAAGISTVITDVLGSGNSSRSFNYGIFPPGAYNVRATCSNGSTAPVAFTINTPPTVTVVDPDETGDPSTDYGLDVRNDPWDFEQLTDVARTFNIATTGGACPAGGCGIRPTERPGATGNMLRVSSIDSGPGTVGDPGLGLLDGALVPLNSRRHQFLTFSLRNNRPYLLNAVVGPVLRLFWSSAASGDAYSMTVSQDMRVWPGFKTYTVDLAALATNNGGIETECVPTCPTIPWAARAIRHLRLDPHEYNDTPTTFDIDDITLTAPDEVALGQQFTVRYTVADADTAGSTYTARVYREDWAAPAGRTLVHNIGAIAPGALTFALDPQARGIPAGTYRISIDIDEVRSGFTQTSRAYATGPLVVFSASASAPSLTVTSPVAGQVQQSITVQGCAYDGGAASGIGMDEIFANVIAGPNVIGQPAGRVIPLGFGSPRGTIEFGPLGTPVVCPSITNTASPFRNSGFRIANVGLEPGSWTLRVYARSTVSGRFVQFTDIPLTVGDLPPAPVNFQASAAGNSVTVSFQAPAGGTAIAGYLIQGSTDPSFTAIAFGVPVSAAGTYSGQLASGTYYLRALTRDWNGRYSAPSATQRVDVALPTPPGAPALVAAQVASNPITLTWSAGAGGAPTSYTVYAGTTPGASNLAIAPMGLATSISASAPIGSPVYVRVVASNAAGSATSNEIVFTLAPPAAPTMSPATVAGGQVTLRWSAVANAASYTVLARLPGSSAIIASLPVTGGTTVTVPAPRGNYLVTVVSNNGLGTSAESNPITVVVP